MSSNAVFRTLQPFMADGHGQGVFMDATGAPDIPLAVVKEYLVRISGTCAHTARSS
jgi:hypothetical protein